MLDLILPPGQQQSDDYIDVPSGALTATHVANTTPGANTAVLQRFRVAAPFVLGKIAVYNGATSAGNVDAGIYTSDGSTWTRVASNGGVAAGSANAAQEIAMSAAYTLAPGVDYWVAIVASDGTHMMARVNASLTNWSGHGNRVLSKASSYPLPASLTTLSKASHVFSFLLVR